jgi:hypothetical protein
MSVSIFPAEGNSEGDARLVVIEVHPNGGAWIAVACDGEELGVEVSAEVASALAAALRGDVA